MNSTWGKLDSPWLHESLTSWNTLFAKGQIKAIKKNTALYNEGEQAETVFLVTKGRFRISSYQEDGNERQLFIAETGSLCGEGACIYNIPYFSTALAIVNSEVITLPRREFIERLHANTPAMIQVLRYEIRKRMALQNQLLSLTYAPASCRIARTLLDLYQRYGEETPQGHCLNIHFTKNDIAGIVGTSRVTASSEMTKMEQEGLLIRKESYYIITNMDRLKALANS